MNVRTLLCAAVFLLALPAASFAGARCEQRVMDVDAFRKGLALAVQTREALQRSGASAALLTRAGQDLSEYGLRYSHMGIVTYDRESGRWQVTHLLNECGTSRSALYHEGLANFFMDDLFAFETQIIIPREDVQQALLAAIRSGLHTALHNPAYSTISNPYARRYQNCNQWVLEIVMSAMVSQGAGADRRVLRSRLEHSAYRPSLIPISPAKRLGARMFSPNVHFDDHPLGGVDGGHYQVVTVKSVVSFLAESGLMTGEQVLRLAQ